MSKANIKEALSAFSPSDAVIAQMREQYMVLKVDGIDDKAGLAAVHAARMIVKAERVLVEKTRIEFKAEALEYGRKIDAKAKHITALLLPIEEHLQGQESAVEAERERLRVEAAERKAGALAARMDILNAVGSQVPSFHVEGLSDEEFDTLRTDETEAHAERRRIAQAEEERLQAARKAEAEAAEVARVEREQESARIAKERAEHDEARAKQKVLDDAERAKLDEEKAALAAKERKFAEAEAEAERKSELERAREESAAKARAEIAREKSEAEAKAKREAKENVRVEALRPDYEKVTVYLKAVRDIPIPKCAWSVEIRDAMQGFVAQVDACLNVRAGDER